MESSPYHGHGDGRAPPPRGQGFYGNQFNWRRALVAKILDPMGSLNRLPAQPTPSRHAGALLTRAEDNSESRYADNTGGEMVVFSPAPRTASSADSNGREIVLFPSTQKQRRTEKCGENAAILSSPPQKFIRNPNEGYSVVVLPPKTGWFSKDDQPKSIWSFDGLTSKYRSWERWFYKGCDIIDKFGQGPGVFEDIGADASTILTDDFIAISLAAAPEQSFTAGMTFLDPDNLAKFLLKGRFANTTMFLNVTKFTIDQNAARNTVVQKFMFHDILGANSKSSLYIPFPCENEMFEVETNHRYAGLTASIRKTGVPHVAVTFMLGTYLFALGGKFEVNTENMDGKYSCGGTFRTSDFSCGLILHQNGQIHSAEASVYKKFDSYSLACRVSHAFVDSPWAERSTLSLGAAYPIPAVAVTLKARASTDGLASLLVKKTVKERVSVILSTDVNLRDAWRAPKVGVMLSIS